MRAVVFVLVLQLSGVAVGQTTWLVPAQVPTIQAAIDGAANGDVISVAPGIYNEAIDFGGREVTVVAAQGPVVTVLDGTGLMSSVVTLDGAEGPGARLSGFTITGGLTVEGGGLYVGSGVQATIERCIVRHNVVVGGYGAGIACIGTAAPVIRDCLVHDNDAQAGGAGGLACIFGATPTVTNCTFALNTATFGAGVLATVSDPVITNSIIWLNTPDDLFVSGGAPVIAFCDVAGGWPGAGNIATDPLFADVTTGDFGLQDAFTPCIDVGDAAAPGLGMLDVFGEPRVQGAGADLGAVEFPMSVLGLPAYGTVGSGAGGPFDVLTLNGSTGGSSRRVITGFGAPLAIGVTQPPSDPTPAHVVIWGVLGIPTPADVFGTPAGLLCFPPHPLFPGTPTLFTVADAYTPANGLVPGGLTPWFVAGGSIPAPFVCTLQGLVLANPPTGFVGGISNAVILDVQ